MIPLLRRLELSFWSSLPSIITLLLLALVLAPKHVAALSGVMPLLPLIPVFYWGMLHAREIPYGIVFFIGLVLDAATASPLGLSSLLFMLFLRLLRTQRKYFHKEGFIVKWGYFATLLFMVCALHYLCVAVLKTAPPLAPVIVQWLLTVFCYPLFHSVFDGISNGISERRWNILHG